MTTVTSVTTGAGVTSTASRVPVTILTGFLGAGKTTLLNCILREQHGRRIAVIENEFGEAGIDNDLLIESHEEQIIEMNNGCICCTVRGDLVRILGELRDRREQHAGTFDYVIIETTGLADPAPVAQTFFIDEAIAAYYRLDAIVTVVDAVHAEGQLEEHHEAQEQVGFADRILVSKTDLVQPDDLARLHTRLRRINPRAGLANVYFGETALDRILDINGFSLDGILEVEPGFLDEDAHEHDEDVTSFFYRSETAFDATLLENFLRTLVAERARDLMRYKGIVNFAGLDCRVVFQGVHMLMNSDIGRPWAEYEVRRSTLVFIGRNLPKEQISDNLTRCLAGVPRMVSGTPD